METFAQLLVSGLLLGGVLAMLASGLALVFGVMRVVNFAHGDLVMLGMYAGYFAFVFTGAPSIVLAVIGFIVVGVIGWVVHVGLVSRVTGEEGVEEAEAHKKQIVLTLGVALVLQNGALMLVGPNPRIIRPEGGSASWNVAGIFVSQPRAVAAAAALLLSGGLFWLLSRTATGRALRAAADDPEAATYVGVNVKRAHAVAFTLAAAMTGFGGALLATFYPMQPYVSWTWVVLLFIAVVLGGLGSILGAFLGGLAIGVLQSLSLLILPLQLQLMAVFIVFLVVLYVRPQGLLGRAVRY